MSFIADAEGENIGREANQIIENSATEGLIGARNRLHICGDGCPNCGNIVLDREDNYNWAFRLKRWALALTVRKPAPKEYDADSYPVSKHNRHNKKGRRQ